jgi:hypothetical protein
MAYQNQNGCEVRQHEINTLSDQFLTFRQSYLFRQVDLATAFGMLSPDNSADRSRAA